MLTWQLYDPLQRRLETFPLEYPVATDDDVRIRPELEHCESENNSIWLGIYSINYTLSFHVQQQKNPSSNIPQPTNALAKFILTISR